LNRHGPGTSGNQSASLSGVHLRRDLEVVVVVERHEHVQRRDAEHGRYRDRLVERDAARAPFHARDRGLAQVQAGAGQRGGKIGLSPPLQPAHLAQPCPEHFARRWHHGSLIAHLWSDLQ